MTLPGILGYDSFSSNTLEDGQREEGERHDYSGHRGSVNGESISSECQIEGILTQRDHKDDESVIDGSARSCEHYMLWPAEHTRHRQSPASARSAEVPLESGGLRPEADDTDSAENGLLLVRQAEKKISLLDFLVGEAWESVTKSLDGAGLAR